MTPTGYTLYNENYSVGHITVESDDPLPDWVKRFLQDNPDMHIPTASKMFAYMGFRVVLTNHDGTEVNVHGERITA